ncbi:hypothetical protein [Spirochaeta cellobiosiphila]|uniref:hypothetical protein n=1 Tax=Spirochaeta cellobiosiphila TaxID=504483 RepID=UPI0004120C3C|nr:hypothetical protein [Spirochaeta cellobiosiphila]
MKKQEIYILGCVLTSVIFFVLSLFINNSGKTIQDVTLSSEGGLISSFEISRKNQVISVKVSQNLDQAGGQNTVLVDLLDKNSNVLLSVSKDLYYETGYDSEGAWTDSDTMLNTKFTIPEPGQYGFRINTNHNDLAQQDIEVKVIAYWASTLPFTLAGWLFAILALGSIIWVNRRSIKDSTGDNNE